MRGGHAPIQIQRWAPYDYVNDPFVKRLYLERDFRTAAFYPMVLFQSFLEGGDLPADPRQLAAVVLMRPSDVAHALSVCLEAGKLEVRDGRVFHRRVVQEVAEELKYRENQAVAGRKGGRPSRKGYPKGSVLGNQTPPSPSPSPLPPPIPVTDLQPAAADPPFKSAKAVDIYRRFYPDGEPSPVMLKTLKPLVAKHGWTAVEPEMEAFLAGSNTTFRSWPKFAEGFGTWARGSPPNGNGAGKRTANEQRSLERALRLAGMGAAVDASKQRDVGPRDVGSGATPLAGGGRGDAGPAGGGLPAGTPALPDGSRVAPRRE